MIPAGGNHFDKYSSRNPAVRFLTRRFCSAVQELAKSTGVKEVHEVGCGDGHLTRLFASGGFLAFGSDRCPEIISWAEAETERNGGRARFLHSELGDLSPEKGAAPLILCCEVLEHLEDPDAALRKLAELARPFVILSVPSEPLWRFLNFGTGRYMRRFGNTPGHLQHWSPHEFIRTVERHFDVLEVRKPLPWTVVLARTRA